MQPYNAHDDMLRATTMEIISTLKELLHLHPLYNEQMRNFIQASTPGAVRVCCDPKGVGPAHAPAARRADAQLHRGRPGQALCACIEGASMRLRVALARAVPWFAPRGCTSPCSGCTPQPPSSAVFYRELGCARLVSHFRAAAARSSFQCT